MRAGSPLRQAPVAQLDRALPSEGRGQRFESSRVHHYIAILSYCNYWFIGALEDLSSAHSFRL